MLADTATMDDESITSTSPMMQSESMPESSLSIFLFIYISYTSYHTSDINYTILYTCNISCTFSIFYGGHYTYGINSVSFVKLYDKHVISLYDFFGLSVLG
ncbi:hypothetical protein DFS33DRAFT_1388308 [Desarmillaria ectypa]|nr:hypothetical protein DFS33DRAFT_1388308 [Desarmillaria ectypa]